MKRTIALIGITLLCSFKVQSQEFKASEVVSLFKKSFNQVAEVLLDNHYSYTSEQKLNGKPLFTYRREKALGGYYTLQTCFKNDRLSIFSTQEETPYFNHVLNSLREAGFQLHKSYPTSTDETPAMVSGAMYSYVNQKSKMVCNIIFPYNFGQRTNKFEVNYGNLTDAPISQSKAPRYRLTSQ